MAGRPTTQAEIRRLIRQMAQENATWGAPRIHGELLELGYVVGERTVSRYLARVRPEPTTPSSQTWLRDWYNQDRVHLALGKDAPDHRPPEPPELGRVVALPRVGGLHRRYSRRAA